MKLTKQEKIYRLNEAVNNMRNAIYNLNLANDYLKTNITLNSVGFKSDKVSEIVDNLYWYISEFEYKIIPEAERADDLDDKF